MSALSRKLRRDLLNTRALLLSVILVVLVGVACFVGMASVYANLESARRSFYASCRMADFWVECKKVPIPQVEALQTIPGVARAQPRIAQFATLDLPDATRPINAMFISHPAHADTVVNDFVLVRGSRLSGNPANEAVLTDAFARAHNLEPGDTFQAVLNNRRQNLLVVGTAVASEFTYLISPGSLIPDPEAFGIIYINERFARDVLDFDGACNQIVGTLEPGSHHAQRRILDEIQRRLDSYAVFLAYPRSEQSSHQILMGELTQLRATAIILPAIFLAIAALILNILMSRLAEQQRVVIGTLKAIGYPQRTLLAHFLSYALVVGLIGGALGLAAGYALAQGMTVLYRQYFGFPELLNKPLPAVYVLALLIGIAFSILGAIRGVRAVLRLQPAQAMRPAPPASGSATPIERFRALWSRLSFRSRMAARTLWRHKWRTAVGLFTAAMASALMYSTFYFVHSTDALVRFQFEKVLLSDVDLTLDDEANSAALLEARRLPGVDLAEPILNVACNFRHANHTKRNAVIGVTPGARLTIPHTADAQTVPIPPSGLLMSRALADQLDLRPGDTVTMTPIKGLRRPTDVTVAAVIDGYLGLATYADYHWLNRIVGEHDALSSLQLKVSTDPTIRANFFRTLKRFPAVQAVSDTVRAKDGLITTMLDTVRYSIGALIVLAAVMFFGSILTTSLIAIAERRREIATLHAMGHARRAIGAVFLRESLAVNLAGALLGLPLGRILAVLLIEENSRDAYRFPIIDSPQSAALTLALALTFTLLAHVIVRRSIDRLDWLDALKAKE